MKRKNDGRLQNDALYWQKKYLELNADCKDLMSAVSNLCLDRGTSKEPIMIEFNDPHGYPSYTLDLLREAGLWELMAPRKNKKSED